MSTHSLLSWGGLGIEGMFYEKRRTDAANAEARRKRMMALRGWAPGSTASQAVKNEKSLLSGMMTGKQKTGQ